MNIKNIKITEIKEYEKNPRMISAEAIDKVASSISNFGFRNPILIDKDNIIIAGHTRKKAAEKLGLAEVPCIICDDLPEQKVRALRLADNKTAEYSVWDNPLLKEELKALCVDFDMSQFGFDFEDVDNIREDIMNIADIEEQIAEISGPETKKGDIYQLGDHFLICGDSTKKETYDALCSTAGITQADMILTDPPYNVNYEGKCKFLKEFRKVGRRNDKIDNDNLPTEQFIAFIVDYEQTAIERLKKGGAIYEWHSCFSQDQFLRAHFQVEGIKWASVLIWEKNGFSLGRQDYQWKHEPCFYGWKEGAGHYFYYERTLTTILQTRNDKKWDDMSKEELLKMIREVPTDVIKHKKQARNDLHPTMKPIELMSQLIRNSSRKGETVLDCFGGSGSTLIACEKTGRKCLMIEYDEHYCDVIVQRWQDLTKRKGVKIAGKN